MIGQRFSDRLPSGAADLLENLSAMRISFGQEEKAEKNWEEFDEIRSLVYRATRPPKIIQFASASQRGVIWNRSQ
jgi:hypothetical protein